jgi:hypothetical protein
MKKSTKSLFFILFSVSGVCGAIYTIARLWGTTQNEQKLSLFMAIISVPGFLLFARGAWKRYRLNRITEKELGTTQLV